MSDIELEAGPPVANANSNLLGQAEAEAGFLSAFNSGKLPHAWLICGPNGIGKATLAHRIARFVLTHGAPIDDGPGLFDDALLTIDPTSLATDLENPVCRRIIAGSHADFLHIQRSEDEKTGKLRKEITVNEVRAVGSFLSMTPAEGGWRVVVIDSADEMNANAANAVLKVLEEPPKRALLLLVSHNPGRLLPTIRSRCRRLVLKPLPERTIADLLAEYDPEILPQDATELAQIADGSIGRALDLADEGGLEVYREINGILETLPQLDIPRLHKLGDKLARDNTGQLFERACELINRWLVDVIRGSATGGQQSAITSLDPWIEVWENTGRLFQQAKGLNLDRKQVILNTFLSIEGANKN
jgi:DNA polymerase III subunit delta'